MSFAVGDLVKVLESGRVARVQEVREGDEVVLLDEPVRNEKPSGWPFTVKASELVDEYEFEREAGHYGLTPKGVQQ